MNSTLFVLMLAILAPGALLGSDLPELPRDVGEWVRVLVPLRIQVPVSGLYGTEWTSELTAWNEESVAIVQGSPFVCNLGIPCPPPLRQKADAVWSPYSAPARGNNRAVILFVERRAAASVWFALTLHERFTAELTAIPVVREDDFLRGGVVFPDVPVSAARRIHVRIYDPFNEPDSVAEVVIEDALTREILGSSSVALEQAA
ncbi:MAG TPA: hypothetical protein VMS56_11400, partial [Thermoanaerobaculia bacterium]|nr:hypothetical protein [Thermoanaerobaculia bacterium]